MLGQAMTAWLRASALWWAFPTVGSGVVRRTGLQSLPSSKWLLCQLPLSFSVPQFTPL